MAVSCASRSTEGTGSRFTPAQILNHGRSVDHGGPSLFLFLGAGWPPGFRRGYNRRGRIEWRIAAGDRMLVSVEKSLIDPASYLGREIDYLTSHGYKWVNQWSLRPGA